MIPCCSCAAGSTGPTPATITAAGQNARDAMFGPYLEVEDAHGNWVKAVADVGLPAGRPRTIAVDLSGKFLSASRRVRITTQHVRLLG